MPAGAAAELHCVRCSTAVASFCWANVSCHGCCLRCVCSTACVMMFCVGVARAMLWCQVNCFCLNSGRHSYQLRQASHTHSTRIMHTSKSKKRLQPLMQDPLFHCATIWRDNGSCHQASHQQLAPHGGITGTHTPCLHAPPRPTCYTPPHLSLLNTVDQSKDPLVAIQTSVQPQMLCTI